jgi:hypothetical protein
MPRSMTDWCDSGARLDEAAQSGKATVDVLGSRKVAGVPYETPCEVGVDAGALEIAGRRSGTRP